MENLTTVWSFVEKYYEGYSSCDEIAHDDDLQKVADGEINGCAITDYKRIAESLGIELGLSEDEEQELRDNGLNYIANISKEDHQRILAVAQNELEASNAYVYEKAIEGFIDAQNSKEETKTTYYLFGEQAVEEFNDDYDNFLELIQEDLPHNTLAFIEGETPSQELANAFHGWDDFAIITEEQYNQINAI